MDESPGWGFKPEACWPNGRVGKWTNKGFITAAYSLHVDEGVFKEIQHIGLKAPTSPGMQLHVERHIS